MKTEWFSTIIAIAISKKKTFTGSFIAMELLELCCPLTKERNNGLGSQVPPPKQDRDIAQCRPAVLWKYCEHSMLWFKRMEKFLLPVLIWQITYFTLVNSSKYVCDCTNKWITPFMSLEPVLQSWLISIMQYSLNWVQFYNQLLVSSVTIHRYHYWCPMEVGC